MNNEMVIESWADSVEEEMAEQHNNALSASDRPMDNPPPASTEPEHENRNEEDHYARIAESVENLTVHSPAPVAPDIPTPVNGLKSEPQPPQEKEETNFVPGGVIRFLPKKLQIRIDPSQGWTLKSSDTPPEPPRLSQPPYDTTKVGVTIDGYNPDPSEPNSGGSCPANVPVLLTASNPNHGRYVDHLGRTIPRNYIYFDQQFKNDEVRKAIFDSIVNDRKAKLRLAVEVHLKKLQEWRINRRLIEQALVEAEWDSQNFSIFHPEVTEEDIEESRRYVRTQNQLDRDGRINRWFNGNPDSLGFDPENKEHQDKRGVKGKDIEIKSEPAKKTIATYADAIVHGAPGPGKLELDAERKRKIAERNRERLERRKEKLKLRTNREAKDARKKSIIEKRERGVLPPRSCPKCGKTGHWRIDCPDLKTNVSKPSKKPQTNPKLRLNQGQNQTQDKRKHWRNGQRKDRTKDQKQDLKPGQRRYQQEGQQRGQQEDQKQDQKLEQIPDQKANQIQGQKSGQDSDQAQDQIQENVQTPDQMDYTMEPESRGQEQGQNDQIQDENQGQRGRKREQEEGSGQKQRQKKKKRKQNKKQNKKKEPDPVVPGFENCNIRFEDSKRNKGKYPVLFNRQDSMPETADTTEPQVAGFLPWRGDAGEKKPSRSPWD